MSDAAQRLAWSGEHDGDGLSASPSSWDPTAEGSRFPLRLHDIWTRPLPALANEPGTRLFCRTILHLWRQRVQGVRGIEHVLPDRDPFILACNHSQRLEALIVPTLLIFLRGGHRIHFLADWNFLLLPLVNSALRRSQVIVVGRKSARPRFLNHLRPWLVGPEPPLRQALDRLRERRSVGIFPEGTVNRSPRLLLSGESGAARLALLSGTPVVPLGIRFHGLPPGVPIHERAPFSIDIGAPLDRHGSSARLQGVDIRRMHAWVMRALARHSGKCWLATEPSPKGELS